MRTKKIVVWLLTSIAVCVLFFLAARQVFFRTYAQMGVEVRPYVAQLESVKVTPEGETLLERRTEYRRRDGAVHRSGKMFREDGSEAGAFRRVDFPDGFVGMIVDAIKAKATGRISSRRLAAQKLALLNPPVNCAWQGHVVDGEETLFGHRAIRLTRQVAQDSLEREISWALPDFNCVTVQVYLQKKERPEAEWRTWNALRLVAFVETEPDERVFRDWLSYQEMKPSELKRRLAEHARLTPESCPACFAEDRSDREYALSQTRR